MNRELLLAIDIGTTNSKGALFTLDGEVAASASCRHQVSHPHPGWAEHDAVEVWWKEFCFLCRKLLDHENISAKDIISVGISSLTPAVLPVDRQGEPLRPAMLYSLDTRAAQEIRDINRTLGETYSLQENKRPISPKSTGPKILWIRNHEPEVFANTAYYMGAPTFLVHRLTGEVVADYGCYKLAGLPFSLKAFGWDHRACEACGVRMEQLPKLRFATELAGTVTEEAARHTGLAPGTLVAVGTGDFLAETLSYGTDFLGLPQISYGTCVGVDNGNDHASILFPDYVPNVNQKTVPGGSMSNGCGNIDWMISMLSGMEPGKRLDSELLAHFAQTVPAGSNGLVMLPYFNGEKTPFDDPEAKGLLFGLRMSHTQADLYKAALEGTAYAIRHVLDMKPGGHDRRQAVVMGGGINIPGLLQTVSDVTGYRQTTLESYNGSLVGDAFIAGMACGVFQERSEINAWVKTSRTIEPSDGVKEVYDRGYQMYLDLYQAVSGLMHRPCL